MSDTPSHPDKITGPCWLKLLAGPLDGQAIALDADAVPPDELLLRYGQRHEEIREIIYRQCGWQVGVREEDGSPVVLWKYHAANHSDLAEAHADQIRTIEILRRRLAKAEAGK